jgi:hypothetical protein
MKDQWRMRLMCVAMVAVWGLLSANHLAAQTGSGSLNGTVTDPSGAAVADVSVRLTAPGRQALELTTNRSGGFEIKGLAPGKYTLQINVKGFARYTSDPVEIRTGQTQQLDVALAIEERQEEVTVADQAPTVDASASNNASSVVLSSNELDALPDDPDELQADLQALAGPSAGPNGGQMFVDGFTNGQLPPKSAIREIRLNQNPFSAEYDKMGFGRIEIFTRPGSDKFHGRFELEGNASALNSKNPLIPVSSQPPYDSTNYEGNVGGPISKVASFFLNAEHRNVNDTSIINAVVLDPTTLTPVSFNAGIASPQRRTNVRPVIQYQVTKNNTLTARYQFFRDERTNVGLGQFSLPAQGYNVLSTEHGIQLSDTQILGERTVNETRFQYLHDSSNQIAQSSLPTVRVIGAFTDGGTNRGSDLTTTRRYEFQNYTSMLFGKHMVKFGGRVRVVTQMDNSTANFNGMFTFSSITAYQLGSPSQFSITAGSPIASASLVDTGIYVQDEWRLRPSITLSSGLRFETQTRIPDHADAAPRVGLAWALGGGGKTAPKTVVRAGFGVFYDRFTEDLVLQAQRLNGVTQQQYIVTSPTFFPVVPSVSSLTGAQTSPTVYRIDPNLRAPYLMQAAASVERQLTKVANVSLNYLYTRGLHSLLVNNINAPIPGSITASNPTGTRPLGNIGNIYQYESNGVFRQNQLIANLNIRAGAKLQIWGNYVLNYAQGDTAAGGGGGFGGGGGGGGFGGGGGTTVGFPSNPYDLLADYGRTAFDIRHRVNIGGTIGMPYAFRLSPFVTVTSGAPFNITVGQDLNGDSVFNDRPAFATGQSAAKNVVVTRFGTFDTVPVAGETIIPVNYGTGPSHFALNLRVSKMFGFGPAVRGGGGRPQGPGGGGPGRGPGGPGGPSGFGGFGGDAGNRRYNVTLSVNVRNLFNNVNLGNPVGNLGSPLFGQSNSLAGGPFSSGAALRKMDLQLVFAF